MMSTRAFVRCGGGNCPLYIVTPGHDSNESAYDLLSSDIGLRMYICMCYGCASIPPLMWSYVAQLLLVSTVPLHLRIPQRRLSTGQDEAE